MSSILALAKAKFKKTMFLRTYGGRTTNAKGRHGKIIRPSFDTFLGMCVVHSCQSYSVMTSTHTACCACRARAVKRDVSCTWLGLGRNLFPVMKVIPTHLPQSNVEAFPFKRRQNCSGPRQKRFCRQWQVLTLHRR